MWKIKNRFFKNEWKDENVFIDMVANIHNILLPILTNTQNSIWTKVFLMFNLNYLQIKTFDEFIVDHLSKILQGK